MTFANLDSVNFQKEDFIRLLKYNNIPMVVHDSETVLHVNPQVVSFLGAPNSDVLIGKKILDFIAPEFRDIVKQRMIRAFELKENNPPIEQNLLDYNGNLQTVKIESIAVSFGGRAAVLAIIRPVH